MAGLDTAFIRAREEWDDRYARQSRTIRNWQIAALVALAMAAGFAAALIRLSAESRIAPYVVEVDRHGDAVAFGPAERLAAPDERVVRFLLAEFVHNVRTVLADAGGQRYLIDQAYAYSRGEATRFLNDFYRADNPFEAALRASRRVEVTSVLPVATDTWQVQWTERTLSKLGRSSDEVPWQAVLIVEEHPPTRSDTLLTNPLGLYVTELTWQRTRTDGGTS